MYEVRRLDTGPWQDLLVRIVSDEYALLGEADRAPWDGHLTPGRGNPTGAPVVVDPTFFFTDSNRVDGGPGYEQLKRLAVLEDLMGDHGLTVEDAVALYTGTYPGDVFPVLNEVTFYEQPHPFHFVKVRTEDHTPSEFLDLLVSGELFVQREGGDGFAMSWFDLGLDLAELADELNRLLDAQRFHLLTFDLPYEHSWLTEWYTTTDLPRLFARLCESDAEAIESTYDLLDWFRATREFEGIACHVTVQHPYKGGGFSCMR